jgi:hypothetical protein
LLDSVSGSSFLLRSFKPVVRPLACGWLCEFVRMHVSTISGVCRHLRRRAAAHKCVTTNNQTEHRL